MRVPRSSSHARLLTPSPPHSYAEFRPDEALLSVNTFQKDLSHPSPRVRASALRVLSSIRVHVIVPVVILAIRACSRDPSPHVRKAAAHAVPKMWRLDRGREEELVEMIEALLRDGAPMVLSSAVAAFMEVCPHRLDLLHRHYRKLCCLLVDTDEWGQALLASLLLRYARTQFTAPDDVKREHSSLDAEEEGGAAQPADVAPGTPGSARTAASTPGQRPFGAASAFDAAMEGRRQPEQPEHNLQALLKAGAGFYDEEEDEQREAASGKKKKGQAAPEAPQPAAAPEAVPSTPEAAAAGSEAGGGDTRRPGELDEDHRLLLRCSRPLLQSRNSAVVLAVATLQWYLAPVSELPRVVKALVFALRSSPEAQFVLLQNMVSMAVIMPALFAPYAAVFFTAPRDAPPVRALKLELLTRCATPAAADRLLTELQLCLRDGTPSVVVLAVRAVGRVAVRLPGIAPACVRSLMELTSHPAEEVAAEAVVVLRALIQQRPAQHGPAVLRLIRRLDRLRAPAARAAVVWLAAWDEGALAGTPDAAKLAAASPHALRLVARTFGEEEEAVKLALLGSCAKLKARSPEDSMVSLLYRYVLDLAAVDSSYDVRDRARMLLALQPPAGAADPESSLLAAHAKDILLCPMPHPPLPSPASIRTTHVLNSLSHSVQHTAPGYVPLPPHPEVAPPGSVRAAPVRAPLAGAMPGGPGAGGVLRGPGGPGGRRGPGGGVLATSGTGFYSDSDDSGSSGSSSTGSSSYSDSDESGDDEPAAEAPKAAAGEPAHVDDPTAWGSVPDDVTTSMRAAQLEEQPQ